MFLGARPLILPVRFCFLRLGRNLILFYIYECMQSLPNALSYTESRFMIKYSQRNKRCSHPYGSFNSKETKHAFLTVVNESYQC